MQAMTVRQPKKADAYNRENPAYSPTSARPSGSKSGKKS